jgi:hypothetical protein
MALQNLALSASPDPVAARTAEKPINRRRLRKIAIWLLDNLISAPR